MGNFLGIVDKDLIKGSFFVKLCEMRMLFGGKYTKSFVDNILSKEGFFAPTRSIQIRTDKSVCDILAHLRHFGTLFINYLTLFRIVLHYPV
jgi:hypothetical protein